MGMLTSSEKRRDPENSTVSLCDANFNGRMVLNGSQTNNERRLRVPTANTPQARSCPCPPRAWPSAAPAPAPPAPLPLLLGAVHGGAGAGPNRTCGPRLEAPAATGCHAAHMPARAR